MHCGNLTPGGDGMVRSVMQSPRILRLRGRVLADGGAARGEPGYRALARMLAHTKYRAVTWGQRRGFGLKALAEAAPLAIGRDDRLVGEHLFSEATFSLDFGLFDEVAAKQLEATSFDTETKAQIAEYLRVEKIEYSAPAAFTGGESDVDLGGGWNSGLFWAHGSAMNHSVRDFGKVVRIGFSGIRKEIDEARSACGHEDPDYPRRGAFWKSAEAVCDAGIILGGRYAATAASLAAACADPVRREELEDIAEICRRVPAEGARTFREAVQALWFTHILTCASFLAIVAYLRSVEILING